jgi:ribosomal protein S18 acetylase RimI-like enzyme
MGLATITAIVHEDGQGYIHMVASKPECRGLGIGNAMNYLAMKKLY